MSGTQLQPSCGFGKGGALGSPARIGDIMANSNIMEKKMDRM
jgi:hypothetical protein